MIFILVISSLATAFLSVYLHLHARTNQYELALSLPIVTTTLLVGVLFNVMILESPAFANMRIPMIIAGVLFVVTFLLSGILTPLLTWAVFAGLTWAVFAGLIGMPFSAVDAINGVTAIGITAVAIFLTWLFECMLETLIISLVSSINVGFGISLLLLPNLDMMLMGGGVVTVLAFLGVVFLTRKRWGQGLLQVVETRFSPRQFRP